MAPYFKGVFVKVRALYKNVISNTEYKYKTNDTVHTTYYTIKKLSLNFLQQPKVNTLHTTYYSTHITNIKLQKYQPTYHSQDEVAIVLAKTLNTATRFPTVADTPVLGYFCFLPVSAMLFLTFSSLVA